jgi:hypothetical protein
MNRYLKLVHYEFTRIRWMYISLFVVTLLSQFGGLFIHTRSTMNRINNIMVRESLSDTAFVQKYGKVGFYDFIQNNIWFTAPIAICIAALLLYVFLIWYRDWIGKNMFIYRLLMLPTSRMNIFWAKLSVIVMTVLGLVAFQLLLLPLINGIYNTLISSTFRDTMSIVDMISLSPFLSILIPQSFILFALFYGVGIMAVIVIFTAILIERSYRWKGIIGGIAYSAIASLIFVLPILISEIWLINYFYPIEIILLEMITGILVIGASIWISFLLIKHKVYV